MTFINNNEYFVSRGKARVLCEMNCEIHPPMSRVIDERFDVDITDCSVLEDRVMFKGLVEVSLTYKHPHLKKKEDVEKDLIQEDDHSFSEISNIKGNDDSESEKKDLNRNDCNIDGIIHFSEETLEFDGSAEVPGAMPGDNYQVENVEVSECEAFKPIKKDEDELITAGKQLFTINVTIKITRIEKEDTFTQQQIFIQRRR